MRYTAAQKARFKTRFIEKRRYQIAAFVPVVGGVALLILSQRHVPDLAQEAGTMILGTAGLLLAAAVFSWLNWRCPACKKFLGRGLSPSQCPRCRVELMS